MTDAVTVKTVRAYKVRNPEITTAWAKVFIDEWPEGGALSIQSDYGDFAYSWSAIGNETLRAFLCSLDYGYFMNKAHPSNGDQFDCDATYKEMKSTIIQQRKEYSLEKNDAREAWDAIDQMDDHHTAGSFWQAYHYEEKLWDIFELDVPTGTRKHPQCVGLWEHIWPLLTDFWKKELNQGQNQ